MAYVSTEDVVAQLLENTSSITVEQLVELKRTRANFDLQLEVALTNSAHDLELALHNAGENRDVQIIQYLDDFIRSKLPLATNPILLDAYMKGVSGATIFAIANRNEQVFDYLFDNRSDAYLLDLIDLALEYAIIYIKPNIFQRLLDYGGAWVRDPRGLVERVIRMGNEVAFLEIMRLCNGDLPNINDGAPLLFQALGEREDRLASLLVFFGADPRVTYGGITAVEYASRTRTFDERIINEAYCQRLAFSLIKARATEIGIQLRTIQMDYYGMIEILRQDDRTGYIATRISDHLLFELIVTIFNFQKTVRQGYELTPKKSVALATRNLIAKSATEDEALRKIETAQGRSANANERQLIQEKFG